MRFNKLDLNLLVALDVLLDESSISRAAARLHLSQSATSGALARLREYFDDQLLVQVGRRMELTPRAEVLRDAVRDVLLRVDTTIAAQPAFEPATADREFRISASDYTLTTVMPQAIALAWRMAPRVRFRLMPQVNNAARALEVGEVDLMIIPGTYGSPDHPQDPLLEEEFVCAVWIGSPLAQGELTFDRYLAAGHVVMNPVGTRHLAFEDLFVQQQGVSRRVEVVTFSFASLPALVVGTDRVATVHARLGRQAAKHWPLVLKKPPLPFGRMVQTMQWHKFRSQDPGLVWLRELLHQAAAQVPNTPAEPD